MAAPTPITPSRMPSDTTHKRVEVEPTVTHAEVLRPRESLHPTQFRCFSCDAYDRCLEIAVKALWVGFDCRSCPSACDLGEVLVAERTISRFGLVRKEIIELFLRSPDPKPAGSIAECVGRPYEQVTKALRRGRQNGVFLTHPPSGSHPMRWSLGTTLPAKTKR
ncbi:MAG: hypothetical protein P1V51_24515 [Deltaproteobacteria bacterium]|nr:hypothetical protein [Deltaproteobacteria bacterium]